MSCYLAADVDDFFNLRRALRNIDFVMRFESLQRDFETVCSKVGIPPATLPRLNQSAKAKFTDYYDDETRDAVAARFRDEIECFEYAFPSSADDQ